MKTIKELKAETEKYMKLQRDEDEEPYIICEAKIKALKDVLKLIDEGCGQYDAEHPELTRCCGDILFNNTIWICLRCKELKARIEG